MTHESEEIYASRWKMAGFALSSFIFVILIIIVCMDYKEMGIPAGILILPSIGIPFFGTIFVFVVYRLVQPRPALIISSEGIYDATVTGVGMIKWEEIAEIYPFRYMMNQLCIVLRDTDAILSRQGLIKRIFIKITTELTQNTICIPQSVLTISMEELLQHIRRYKI